MVRVVGVVRSVEVVMVVEDFQEFENRSKRSPQQETWPIVRPCRSRLVKIRIEPGGIPKFFNSLNATLIDALHLF